MYQGRIGAVYKGINKITCEQVAIKVFPLINESTKNEFANEVKITKMLSGLKHFPACLHTFCKQNKGFIVTQLLPIDLFSLSQHQLSEKVIKKVFLQLCTAIKTMHEHKIAHLDIKPENILLNENGRIVICDFGQSVFFNEDKQLLEGGTHIYRAPEVNRCELSHPDLVDIWSLGILLHYLVTGTFPYNGSSNEEVQENVNRDKICFKALQKAHVSVELKHLIWCILQPNPVKRISLQGIFHHCFFTKSGN